METMELLKTMQAKYKDRAPVKITFRYDKSTKDIIMVYQATYSYDTYVKNCFTCNESHGSIHKDYYRNNTLACTYEEYESTLRTFLLNYPEDNYQIVKRIYWNK